MSYNGKFVSVIVPAAGSGRRMKSKTNKQFILLDNKPMLAHTLEVFNDCKYVDEIIVVMKQKDILFCSEHIIKKYKLNKVKHIVPGGKERQFSVYNGLKAIDRRCNIVLIHDGARPFVDEECIVDGIEGAIQYGACVLGVPVKDTIKVVDDDDIITHTPERKTLWAAHTPQCFSYDLIIKAYEQAIKDGFIGTDDSSLVERIGRCVKMIRGSYDNIKLTTSKDLIFDQVIRENLKKSMRKRYSE